MNKVKQHMCAHFTKQIDNIVCACLHSLPGCAYEYHAVVHSFVSADSKDYLRTTMSDTRLNNLLVFHAHKDRCDSVVLTDCINDVCGREHSLYGKF